MMPMQFHIGSMSLGDILDRGLKLLLARLGTFYLINLIVQTPTLVAQLMMPEVMFPDPSISPEQQAVKFLGGFGGLLSLALLLEPIGDGATLRVITQQFVNERVGALEALRFALRRFFSLFAASLVYVLLCGMGACFCLVPGLIFGVWFAFAAQVIVAENRGAFPALIRSYELTAGFRWRVLGLIVLKILIRILFVTALGLVGQLLPSAEMVTTQSGVTQVINKPNFIINTVLGNLVQILVDSYMAVCFTLFYFDLRIRKEGYDLELAANQHYPTPA
jgi:hypothetical protein